MRDYKDLTLGEIKESLEELLKFMAIYGTEEDVQEVRAQYAAFHTIEIFAQAKVEVEAKKEQRNDN